MGWTPSHWAPMNPAFMFLDVKDIPFDLLGRIAKGYKPWEM